MSPPGDNYEHVYKESFERDKRALHLTGKPFEHFWRGIRKNLDDDPSNIYVRELPESEGFRIYPTKPAHEDFLSCVVYFCVIEAEREIIYFGLEPVPDDWVYVPLEF